MSHICFNQSLYDFLCRASECIAGQPDRQYYFQKYNNDSDQILYLLLKDDPCSTMIRPNQKQHWNLFDGPTRIGYIETDILSLFAFQHIIRYCPDLLETLKKVEAYLQGIRSGKKFEEGDLVDIIKAVIKKVGG